MSILGNRVLRVEDPRFLRGEGRYLENMPLDGALVVTFVRSPLAHARINGVDASAAEALPNVRILTGADVDAPPFGPPPYWNINPGMVRPMVAKVTSSARLTAISSRVLRNPSEKISQDGRRFSTAILPVYSSYTEAR